MGVFKKSRKNVIKIDTLISLETEITGNISGNGNYKIDGNVIGNITVNGDLIVSRDASVTGNLSAKNIMIEGKVEGNVIAEIELVVKDTANIKSPYRRILFQILSIFIIIEKKWVAVYEHFFRTAKKN